MSPTQWSRQHDRAGILKQERLRLVQYHKVLRPMFAEDRPSIHRLRASAIVMIARDDQHRNGEPFESFAGANNDTMLNGVGVEEISCNYDEVGFPFFAEFGEAVNCGQPQAAKLCAVVAFDPREGHSYVKVGGMDEADHVEHLP
jgi:uracil-DNA glycosylase